MNDLILPSGFIDENEERLSQNFIKNGFVIVDIENQRLLQYLRNAIADFIREYFSLESSVDTELLLNETSSFLKEDDLNKFRLNILNKINNEKWFRPTYFKLVEKYLSLLVGNELVMQKKVNSSTK